MNNNDYIYITNQFIFINMYFKYIVVLFLLGLFTLLRAQTSDQNRINIRIFPTQVLSITTVDDFGHIDSTTLPKNSPKKTTITASNLLGYQILLIDGIKLPSTKTEYIRTIECTNDCIANKAYISSDSYKSQLQNIVGTNYRFLNKESRQAKNMSQSDRTLVYLIISR